MQAGLCHALLMVTHKAHQTIQQALKNKQIVRYLNQLVGLPVGGWPETSRAKTELYGELPSREDREYTVQQLIDAALYEDGADATACGRYKWRDLGPADNHVSGSPE